MNKQKPTALFTKSTQTKSFVHPKSQTSPSVADTDLECEVNAGPDDRSVHTLRVLLGTEGKVYLEPVQRQECRSSNMDITCGRPVEACCPGGRTAPGRSPAPGNRWERETYLRVTSRGGHHRLHSHLVLQPGHRSSTSLWCT